MRLLTLKSFCVTTVALSSASPWRSDRLEMGWCSFRAGGKQVVTMVLHLNLKHKTPKDERPSSAYLPICPATSVTVVTRRVA